MAQIQWYPGHMAKAQREVEQKIKLVDIIIELVDARAPRSTKNKAFESIIKNKPRIVVMTKKDLADPVITKQWIAFYQEHGLQAISVDLMHSADHKRIIESCKQSLAEKRAKEAKRGIKPRPIRAMVIGIPNVGKSTFINRLAKRKAAKTGNRPGVTKSQQIIKVDQDFELFDTPGILAPKFDDIKEARNVALVGSIKQDILPLDELMIYALEYLASYYPEALKSRYELDIDLTQDWIVPAYTQIAAIRHLPQVRGDLDYDRVQSIFFKDLSDGVFGPISWERPYE